MRPLLRALAVSALGALAGAACLVAAYARAPQFVASMEGDPPPLVRGLYPVERDPAGVSFAWMGEQASLHFPGLDRTHVWTLVLRIKAGRGPALPLPELTVDVDGVTRATQRVGNAPQEVRVPLPTADGGARGARLTLRASPTFVPGPGDPRALGLVVDEIRLDPSPRGVPIAPRRALVTAASAAALFGAAAALCGLPGWAAILVALFFALAQAVPLSTGAAPYSRAYLDLLPPLTGWVGAAAALIAWLAARMAGRPLSTPAAAAITASMGLLVLELFGLLHPSKAVVDAVFHAHRLEWVLAGRYFFTQPMPSGVQFPYAIALYVCAAPWSALTHDLVALLRLVVSIAHAGAALLLYPLVVRAWGDRSAAVAAVIGAHLVPLPFVIIGNANLTYAFGQSVATMAVASAATWPLGRRHLVAFAGLTSLIAVGLLSHVGLVPLLGGLLVVSAALFLWRGESADRSAGWSIGLATAIAAMLAITLYYAHFGEAYRTVQRVRASAGVTAAEPAADTSAATPAPQAAGSSRPVRLARAARLAADAYGWPLLILAGVGIWRTVARRGRDRLTLVLCASAVVYVGIVGAAIIAPVEPRFERYTDEFINRVHYAVMPAVVILAGAAIAWAAASGAVARGVGLALVLAALALGVRQWMAWIT